jgi:hypothetical protein
MDLMKEKNAENGIKQHILQIFHFMYVLYLGKILGGITAVLFLVS